MNRGIRALLLILCCYLSISVMNAQVTKVKYYLKFDTSTCLYDVNIVIHEGSATLLGDRLQYNSQISLIVGINDSLEIIEKFLPLENVTLIPNEWAISNVLQAPAAQPGSDFYAIVPRLAPTSAYPSLNLGDTLKLMSIRVFRKDGSPMIQCGQSLRFFENGVDPSSSAPGMNGGAFENGFTIGGGDQLYDGNIATTFPPMPDLSYELKCEEGLNIDLNTQIPTCMQPATFNWSGPNGFSSSDEDVMIIPATIANKGQYTVTVTNNLGCTSVITIDAEGKPDAGENKTVCSGAPSTLVGSPSGGNWVPLAGNAAGANLGPTSNGTAVVSFSPSASGEYSFVYGTGLCSDTMKLTIASGLTIAITGDDIFCEGENTTLTTSGGSSYIWSNTESTPSIIVSSPGTYQVTVSDASGCSGTAQITVSQNPKPTAAISGPDAVCVGGDIELIASGGDTYDWDPSHIGETFTVTAAGLYQVTVTDVNGCTDTAQKNISLNAEPIANISGPDDFCQGENITLSGSGGISYLWSTNHPGSDLNVTAGGTYTVTVTDVNGCTASTDKTVIENSIPSVSIDGENSFCEGGSLILTASGGGSYDWGVTSAASLSVNVAGTYTVTVTNSFGCTNTAERTISENSSPIVGISGLHEFCDGESLTMIATGGTTYTWDPMHSGSVFVVTDGGTYFVTVTDANGCTNTAVKIITENPKPIISIDGDDTFCQGGSIVLTATGGINYDWNPSHGGNVFNATTGGTYEVTVTDANGCTATTSKLITENPRPTAVISGDDSICDGFSTTLTASGGDTYIWDNGQTDAILTINSANTYTVTVTDANGCTDMATKTVGTNAGASAVISGGDKICTGGSLILTASGGIDYVWSPSHLGPTNTITSAGTYTVTVTDANGCTGSTSVTVTEFANPIASISGDLAFCPGGSVVLTGNGGLSYLWNGSIVNNNITVSTPGLVELTVTDINGCSANTTVTVIEHSNPIADILGDSAFCTGESLLLTATGGDTYTWNPFHTGANNIVTFGFTYIVTVTDANGCTATAMKTVTENPRPTAVISGDDSICDGFSTILTASGGDTYIWDGGQTDAILTINSANTYSVTVTDANGCTDMATKTVGTNAGASAVISGGDKICTGGSLILTASGGIDYVWSPSHLGPTNTITSSGTYTVTVTDANGCTGSTSVTVTEFPNPVASISGDLAFCPGGSVVLTGNGGLSYLWNGSIVNNNITVSTPGLVELTVTDINGCTANTTVMVVEHSNPIADILGDGAFCTGESLLLTASGGDTYVWTPIFTGATNTITTGGTYEVTVTDANGCTATASKLITENPRPNAVISGDDSICIGFSTTLTASGGDTYIWDGGQTDAILTINSANTYTVTVTDANGCTDMATKTVGTNAGASAVISGGDKICTGGSLILTASGGIDYVWSPSHLGPTNTITSSGTYTVTVTDANGCTGSTSVTVTEFPNPVASISGDLAFCPGGSVVLTGNGGLSYLWNGSIVNYNITVSTPGLVELTVTDINGCSANTTVTVIEHSNPIADILGDSAFCTGESLLLTATGGDTYVWTPIFTGATNTITTGGTYEVTVTDANGCTATASKLITENPRPTAVISGDDSICDGFSTTLSASGGDTYIWDNGQTDAILTINSANTYTVTVTDANGCTDIATKTVGTNAGASAVISGGDKICTGGSLTLTASGGIDYVWSPSHLGPTNTITSAGTYFVTVTDANGCTGSTSVTVTEFPNPVASISGDLAFCPGGSVVLTGNGGLSYLWNGLIVNNNITVSTPGLVELTVTDINGCSANTTVTVVEHSNPIADILGDGAFCTGKSLLLTATGGDTYVWTPIFTGATNTITTGGTYEVTVTDANGCTATASKLITENPRPNAIITGDDKMCEGSSIVLSASGGLQYQWSTLENSQNITVSVTDLYIVTVTDANNCSDTASFNVNVIPMPNAGADQNLGCLNLPGGFAQLYGNGNGIWSADPSNPGSVMMSNVNNQVLDLSGFTTEGIYKFFLTNDICIDEINLEIFRKASAGPDFNLNCYIDGSLNLAASGNGTWTVSINNIGTANISDIYDPNSEIREFSQEGIYEFIWNNDNCQDTVTVIVGNICDCPISDNNINIANDSYCGPVNDIIILGAEALPLGGEYRWEYSFNNAPFVLANDINNLKDLSISNLGIGQHRFKRVYTTIDGIICSSESNILLIEVKELPTAYIIGQNTMCDGQDQNLTAYDGAFYLWSQNNETAQSINISGGGIYTVTVTATNGCEAIADFSVSVNPKPIANIKGETESCDGQVITLTAAGGISYIWNNGQTGDILDVTDSGTSIVTVTDINGCTDVATHAVDFLNTPTAVITGDNEICAGDNTTFTASGGDAYAWNNGVSTANITVNTAQQYIVTVTDTNGCTATASTTLIVTPLPNAGPDASVTCYMTGVAVMSANGAGIWTLGTSAGTATITNPNSPTSTITNFSTNGTYELIWTVNGCSDAVIITVGDDCNCPIIGNIINVPTPANYCASVSAVTISGQAANPAGGSYEWYYSFNGGAFALASGVNNQEDYTTGTLTIGEHRFQRKYTTTTGIICDDLSNIVTINVHALPTASITGDDIICAGESTTLTASGGVSFAWSTSETTNSIIVSNSELIIVTVTDINGCQATAATNVTVHTIPTAIITGDNEICAGENTTFTASGGDAYAWNNGVSTASITVNTAQQYIVTVTDTNGCTATASTTLIVTPQPNAGPDASVTCYMTGVAVMSANGAGIWTLGSSNIGSATITNPNSPTSTITNFSTNGTYELIWTVNGCSDAVIITVGDDCNCPIIGNIINVPTPANYCASVSAVTISGQAANPAGGSYEWYYSFNGGAFALASGVNNQQDYTTGTLTIGEHRFQRKYTTTTGIICDDLSNIVTINVHALPTASITGDDIFCAGESTTLTASGGISFAWSTSETTNSIIVSNSELIIVTVTDINGCQATAATNVTVNTIPTAIITGDNEICAGDNTTFTASGGDAYAWNNGVSNASITVNTAQQYIVTVTDANGCTATASTTLIVTPLPNAGPDASVTCYMTGVAVMSANGAGIWTLGSSNIGSATITNPNSPTSTITNFSTNGTYELIWTVNGCSDAVIITVGDDCNCPIIGNIINVPTPANYCASVSAVTISGQAANPADGSYEWYYSFNGSAFILASGANNQQDYTTGTLTIGEHRFQRKYTTTTGIICDDLSNIVTINVHILPTASITGDDIICAGESTTLTASGGVSFAWSTSETTNSIIVSNSDLIIVTVTDINGCQATAATNVTVNTIPTAIITGDNEICAGDNTTFTASGGDAYAWNNGVSTASITVNTAQQYIVTVTDANGCTATASTTLIVTPLPNAGPDASVTCYVTGVAVMSANGIGIWTLGSSNIGSATITNPNSPTSTITNFSTNGTYELIWTVNGCSDTVIITVGDNCNCPIIGNIINVPTPANYCASVSAVTISGQAANPAGGSYEWHYSFNGGAFALASGVNNQQDYTTGTLTIGEHRFQRKYTTTTGIICDDLSNIVTINVHALPTASITGDDIICAGESTTLTASGGVSFAWSTSETTNSIIVSNSELIIVTVTDINGCQATAATNVTVHTIPTAIITGDNEICAGDNTTFTASGGDAYAWNNGVSNASITVNTAQQYIVTVTDANGCTATASTTLIVTPLPNAGPDASVTCYMTGVAVMSANGAGIWTLGSSNIGSATITNPNSPTSTITNFSTNGTYELIWTVNGCSDTVIITVGDNCNCPIIGNTISPLNGPFCNQVSNVNVLANVASPAGGVYEWQYSFNMDPFTSIAFSNSNDITTQTLGVGNHRYRRIYTITGAMACSDTSNIVSLRVNPNPVAAITGANEICAGSTTIFTASGGTSYIWDFNNATTETINVSEAGMYNVTVTDNNGCQSVQSKMLNVTANPVATIDGAKAFCEGESTVLTAVGGVSYIWDDGSTDAKITITNSMTIGVTVTDGNGCKAIGVAEVKVNAKPTAIITGSDEICTGSSTEFTASGGISYIWNLNNATTYKITVITAGTYTVTVTDANGCTSEQSKTLTITANPVATILGNRDFCEGENTTLTAIGGISYIWENGSTEASITISETKNTGVTVTDANGCKSIGTAMINMNTKPTAIIEGNTSFCAQDQTILTASGGISYVWNDNNTLINNIVITEPGMYMVTVTDVNGCKDDAAVNISVNPLPVVAIAGETKICENSSTQFTASGGDQYSWSNGSPTPSITANTAGTYTVTVTDTNGCKATANTTLIINNLPTAIITGDDEICEGEMGVVSAAGGVDYLWNNGNTSASITIEDDQTYFVTVSDINGCIATASVSLVINKLPIINISGDNSICEGETTQLTATGGTQYIWNNASTSQTLTVSESNNYTVTVTDEKGCKSTESFNLIVNPKPKAEIQGNTEVCKGQSVILTAFGGIEYNWSNGAPTASITANSDGIYSVTVTDLNGCKDIVSHQLSVNELPIIEIVGNLEICEGSSTILTASGGQSYLWNNEFPTQSITVNEANIFSVIGTDQNGCSSVKTVTVTVNNLPDAKIVGEEEICEGKSTLLLATGGEKFQWNNGQINNSLIANMSGIYSVTVTDSNGCSKMATHELTINPLPKVEINGPEEVCEGDKTVFVATGGIDYQWSNTLNGSNMEMTQSGIYTVTVTDAKGCSAQASKSLTINPLPKVSISGDKEICAGSVTNLSVSLGDKYLWSNGETGSLIQVKEKGIYNVSVTNNKGCTGTASIEIDIIDKIASPFDLVANPDPICLGDTVLINVQGRDDATYYWLANSKNAGLKNSSNNFNMMIPESPGKYKVTVSQMHEKCKIMSEPADFEITVNALPRVNLGRDTVICELDGGLTLKVSEYPEIRWNTGYSGTQMYVDHKGKYSVEVMDENGCENKDEITIKEFCCKIYHPNIININSFSSNDQFKVSHSGCVITSKLSIYDRWGNLVYTSSDGLLPWDGHFNGNPVELGVYVFIFTYTALDEDDQEFEENVTGDITVIK
jgi:gliding motility-associated-like protein